MDQLEQKSSEWLEWRKTGIGSSDAPIIMGVSPWSTPLELWKEKTGKVTRELSSYVIDRGNRWEPKLRAMFNVSFDFNMEPELAIHPANPVLRASLDGIDKTKNAILEIKTCGEEMFENAKKGIIDERYIPQLEHQLLVTGVQVAYFFVGHVTGRQQYEEKLVGTAKVEYTSNGSYQDKLLTEEMKFWKYVESNTPPPLSNGDTLEREDEEAKVLYEEIHKKHIVLKAVNDYLETNSSGTIKEFGTKIKEDLVKLKAKAAFSRKHSREAVLLKTKILFTETAKGNRLFVTEA